MDQSNTCGAWSYLDLANPAKGQEGYPRLLIENRAYCSRVFRKLHIELAHRQDGMQVRAWETTRRACKTHAWLGWDPCASREGLTRVGLAELES